MIALPKDLIGIRVRVRDKDSLIREFDIDAAQTILTSPRTVLFMHRYCGKEGTISAASPTSVQINFGDIDSLIWYWDIRALEPVIP